MVRVFLSKFCRFQVVAVDSIFKKPVNPTRPIRYVRDICSKMLGSTSGTCRLTLPYSRGRKCHETPAAVMLPHPYQSNSFAQKVGQQIYIYSSWLRCRQSPDINIRGLRRLNRKFNWSAMVGQERPSLDHSGIKSSNLDELTGQQNAAKLEHACNQRMLKTIRERNLFQPAERILIAVSGGQDSVCLLRILANLQQQWGWHVGVVHCDHQWSPSSRKQGSHVSQIASNLRINYYQAVTTSPVPGECLARSWRYGILQRIALRHGYSSIVTAHTASDRVETFLYNLFRGSGLHGLQSLTWKRLLSPLMSLSYHTAFIPTGVVTSLETPEDGRVSIKNSTVSLTRPLLGFTRTELRELCTLLVVPLWPDPSNMSLEIDRNRVRHQLLPYLRENFQDSVDKSLARCAEILHAEQIYLDSVCETILKKAETYEAGEKKLDIEILQSLPVALQRRVIKQFVENFTGRSLGFEHVERLRATYSLSGGTHGVSSLNLKLSIPGKASVQVLRTHLRLFRLKS